MPEPTEPPATAAAEPTTTDPAGQSTAGETTNTPDPATVPGTPEYRAAAAEKVAKDLERKLTDARKAADRVADLEAKIAKFEGKEAEFTAAQEAARIKSEALAAANERIKKAEIRAAAAGKLTDPADALLYVDPSKFEVSEDGEIDRAAVTAAIEALVQSKPYLAAQGGAPGTVFESPGAHRKGAPAGQLTQADLKGMTPEQINTARAEGRLNDLLGIKN